MPSEKTLKTIVIVLGVLLLAGFFVIVGTIIYRASNMGEAQSGGGVGFAGYQIEDSSMTTFATPEGARLLHLSVGRDIVIAEVETADGQKRTMVYDGFNGAYLGDLIKGEEHEDLPDAAEQN